MPNSDEVSVDKSQHVLPIDQPIVSLEVGEAFKQLSAKEKLYCHYISKASWIGGLITLLQTSPESGPLFVFLHRFFRSLSPQDLRTKALGAGYSVDEVNHFLIYSCGVFSNAGNYKGFGDSKIVPNLDVNRLQSLLSLSPNWNGDLESLWAQIKDPIYNLKVGKTCLGYAPYGCTTYLSSNCTSHDNDLVNKWMKSHKLEGYNTRLFKTVTNDSIDYEIRLASKEKGELSNETVDGVTYRLTRGDYSPLLGFVAENLREAKNYVANATQSKMLQKYCDSFITGALDDHKDGSRYWIQDKSPAVESYIGFIETYRDPAGVRGEFESFVAVVNRQMSMKFSDLVDKAEDLLPLLPWPHEFEKDQFLRPDFTSLDVVTFAGSGIPAGINIPNYDEIRQCEGFKNVSLGNVIPASYQMTVTPFLSESDTELMQKWRVPAFELQVGLHELLGHGSGKLLHHNPNNYPDTLRDPLTSLQPEPCYKPGDTYDAVFGPLSSAYEECRAEAVGLYLSLEPNVLRVFGHETDDVTYVNWLSLVWIGVGRALETWDPKRGWLQAHAQARFVLARVLIEAGVVTVTQPKSDDLLVSLDRKLLHTIGRKAIGDFLLKLQIYKATANVQKAQQLFDKYSTVTEQWISWRSIILDNKQPRKIFNQVNTFVVNDQVELKSYDDTFDGFIESWMERFDDPEPLYKALINLSAADALYFT